LPEEGGTFKLDLTGILEHQHDEVNELCYEQIICSD